MVVIKPFSISKLLLMTLTTGAKQLVVHEAADIILSSFDIIFSFTHVILIDLGWIFLLMIIQNHGY